MTWLGWSVLFAATPLLWLLAASVVVVWWALGLVWGVE